MKKMIYAAWAFIFVFLYSCTWNNLSLEDDLLIPCNPVITLTPNDADSCFEFTSEFETLPQIMISDISFARPCLNPLNENEVILAYSSDTFPQSFNVDYIKINFCSGEWQLTYPSIVIIGQPKWSKSDWVLLGSNGPLYKMKSNGDSLTYLNETAGISTLNNATWIEGGDKIFCYAGTGIGSGVILDKNGVPLDTIPVAIGTPACFGNKIAGYRYVNDDYYICMYDLGTQTLTDVVASPFNVDGWGYDIYSLDWLSTQEVIWCDKYGIHKVNLLNNEITTLKQSCDSNQYYNLTVSPKHNGDFLVDHYEAWVENDTAYHKGEILKINAYSGEEWIVNLEQ